MLTQFKGRVSGIDFKRIKHAESISELNNVERFILELSNTTLHSNSVLTAAATRWCSTVEPRLTGQQVKALAQACTDDANLQPCIADMIAFFDGVTGYVQKPKGVKSPKKVKVALNKGIFATAL